MLYVMLLKLDWYKMYNMKKMRNKTLVAIFYQPMTVYDFLMMETRPWVSKEPWNIVKIIDRNHELQEIKHLLLLKFSIDL